MTVRLPPLRRTRRRLNVARIAARFSEGVAKVEATIEPFAQWWDDHNNRALQQDGPLWVALGDSVTQGVGASAPTKSYPAAALDHVRSSTTTPWRLINLSMSGARFDDVIRHQLEVISSFSLEPAVVSAVIGSNDVIWRRNSDAIIDDARRLVDALPDGTILSRVSEARPDRRRIGVNHVFEAAAATGRVRLYEAWDWPTGEGMWAEDRFHPNDRAHEQLTTNLLDAFDRHQVLH